MILTAISVDRLEKVIARKRVSFYKDLHDEKCLKILFFVRLFNYYKYVNLQCGADEKFNYTIN